MLFLLVLLLFGCLVSIIAFFIFSDSTLNLFLCEKFGISEDEYFAEKVIWVVGASSGIGEAISMRLARRRCRLIMSARRKDKLQLVARSCIKVGTLSADDICILPIDITIFDSLQEKVAFANAYFQHHVDVIVLCSGQSQRAEWIEVEATVDEQCFRVNALGATVLARAAVRYSQRHTMGLHFVVVSSICGIIPAPLSPSYTAAKHALMGYFRLLNLEYSYRGVCVTIVCPSLTYAPNNVLNAFTEAFGRLNGEVIDEITSKYMSSERTAELILLAGANRLSEASLSQTTFPLILAYSFTLFPDLTYRIIRAIGPYRIRRIRTGAD